MEIDSLELCVEEIKDICKQPSLWIVRSDNNGLWPLIYFQKPKWIDKKTFRRIIKTIEFNIPKEKLEEIMKGN